MPQDTSNEAILRHLVKHTESSNFSRAKVYRTKKNKSLFVAFAAAAFAIGTCILFRTDLQPHSV